MPVPAVSSSSSISEQQDAYGVFPRKDSPAFPGMKDHAPESKDSGKKQLTPDQEKEVQKLKARDAQVKAHEAAHVAAGGAYIKGGVSYSYQKGPDGVMYAVGGEVSIDTSPVKNNPKATIAKMEAVKAAALAPADPSGADRSVAAAAQQAEATAQQEMSTQKSGKGQEAGTAPAGDASAGTSEAPRTKSYSPNGRKTANVNPAPQLIDIVA
jgi:hypothetical protein